MTAPSHPVVVDRLVAGPWDANCYVVSVDIDTVVVDPGGQAGLIAERIEGAGLHVHAILATHGHHDHLGAAAELTDALGVPFGIHSAEARNLRRVNFCRRLFHDLDLVELPPIGFDLVGADAPLRFGALGLAVIHTPGHTPGSVCLSVDGALLTGDTLPRPGAAEPDPPEADPAAVRSSVEALMKRFSPQTIVYPGHGEAATLGDYGGVTSATGGSR